MESLSGNIQTADVGTTQGVQTHKRRWHRTSGTSEEVHDLGTKLRTDLGRAAKRAKMYYMPPPGQRRQGTNWGFWAAVPAGIILLILVGWLVFAPTKSVRHWTRREGAQGTFFRGTPFLNGVVLKAKTDVSLEEIHDRKCLGKNYDGTAQRRSVFRLLDHTHDLCRLL